MKKYHIFFSGTVQGVGFRFTTERIARNYQVSGWVRNLSDGRVEMIVEGSEEQIIQLIEDIESHFEGYISEKDVAISDMTDQFKDFRIIH